MTISLSLYQFAKFWSSAFKHLVRTVTEASDEDKIASSAKNVMNP